MTSQKTAGVIAGINIGAGTPAYVSDMGAMPTDPRITGAVAGAGDPGFLFLLPMSVMVAAAPSQLLANNIATAQTGSSGVALTLTAGTGVTSGTIQGISGTSGAAGGTGVLYLDGIPNATNPQLDFTKTLARNVRITSSGSDTGVTFTVKGYDLYGNSQTVAISGANSGIVTTTKCFKSITSVTPSTATASAVQVGTGDTYAFPMRVDNFDEVLVMWNSSLVTATTGFTGADTTNPQTSASGEPKGTYAVQSASNGTKRLVLYQCPKSLSTVATLFGITPA